jgi:hypothetical protein
VCPLQESRGGENGRTREVLRGPFFKIKKKKKKKKRSDVQISRVIPARNVSFFLMMLQDIH